ncbi:MAG: polyprenyl synthetase family protein [Myxococcales bacterium]|nr:polyprenyl synthetase family protein [Myxococcales bacterium]
MANDMLAPYQEHAQHAWESLQPGILAQDQALAPMLAHHFKSTGKLLRPALTLAFFDQLVHGQTTATPQTPAHVTQTALAIELLHNATLVHDDLQDGDTQRRGIPTVWKAFDAYQAINAGSALYFHALQQIANLAIQPLSIVRLQRLLASQTLAIIAGQALEKQLWRPLEVLRSIDTEALYLEVVQKKTSALFALPMMSAAILADIPEDATLVLEEVARPLGALFQIQDDILDLYGNKGRDAIGTTSLKVSQVSPHCMLFDTQTTKSPLVCTTSCVVPRRNHRTRYLVGHRSYPSLRCFGCFPSKDGTASPTVPRCALTRNPRPQDPHALL